MKSLLLLISLISFLSLSPFSFASSQQTFVQCLTTNKIPFYTNQDNNTAYTTILNATIRNLRYGLQSTSLKPTLILVPITAAHVSAAVVCAKNTETLIVTRSGGHDYEAFSYVADFDFVILDMFNIKNILVNVTSKTAWVDSGATLGELYHEINVKSPLLAFPGGVCPTVGIGGHFSGGGYGNMIRNFGLTVDHVVDATIVNANGKILDRKGMGEDLFWAIRGGGGASFGVILSWKIELVEVPDKVTVFKVFRFMDKNAAEILVQYQYTMPTIDNRLFIRVLLQPQEVNNKKTLRTTFIGMFVGGADDLINITDSKFPKLGLTKEDLTEMTWIQSVLNWTNEDYKSTSPDFLLKRTSKLEFTKRKSDYVKIPISEVDMMKIFNELIKEQDVGLVFNPYGGIMNRFREDETPFPHRYGYLFKIQYSLSWKNDTETDENLDAAKRMFKFMTPFVTHAPREAYLNYRDSDIGTNKNGTYEYGEKYFKKENFQKLVNIKTEVDPDNFFRNDQSIPTQSLLPKGGG